MTDELDAPPASAAMSGDYQDRDCKVCGRHRVLTGGVCEKCGHENDSPDSATMSVEDDALLEELEGLSAALRVYLDVTCPDLLQRGIARLRAALVKVKQLESDAELHAKIISIWKSEEAEWLAQERQLIQVLDALKRRRRRSAR